MVIGSLYTLRAIACNIFCFDPEVFLELVGLNASLVDVEQDLPSLSLLEEVSDLFGQSKGHGNLEGHTRTLQRRSGNPTPESPRRGIFHRSHIGYSGSLTGGAV